MEEMFRNNEFVCEEHKAGFSPVGARLLSLEQLIASSFPCIPKRTMYSLCSSDLVYLVYPEGQPDKFVAAAGRQLFTVEAAGQNLRVLSFRNAMVAPDYRGKKLLYWLYELPLLKVRPAIITTTTQHPAVYKTFAQLAENHGYRYWPRPGMKKSIPQEVLSVGKAILIQRGKTADELDNLLVRRGAFREINPYLTSPFVGFPFFESELQLGKTDAALLVATIPVWGEIYRLSFTTRLPLVR